MTARVAILGGGTVGRALVQLIEQQQSRIDARTSIALEVVGVGVRDTAKARPGIREELITDDLDALVSRSDVDVVVELIGGIEPAQTLITNALKSGKAVVSANKELIAHCGHELSVLASSAGAKFAYEAAVAGGIPVIRALRQSLIGENLLSITGIVNGTTNYILTQMTENGASFDQALGEAQQLGFAEADATADVDGFDAASKGRILAQLGFDTLVEEGQVLRSGISSLTSADIGSAERLGYVIKPVIRVDRNDAGAVGVGAYPAMFPKSHPLATVRNSYNALFIQGEAVGDLMFYGQGAGGAPTASAVLGDVIDAAIDQRLSNRPRTARTLTKNVWAVGEHESAFFVTLHVADQPGVLSRIAKVFGDYNISIRSMEQLGLGNEARLLFITHRAKEKDFDQCLKAFASEGSVHSVGNAIRVVE